MDPASDSLLNYGALGVICLILLGWIYYKDRQHTAEVGELRKSLTAEQTARVDDAKQFAETALALQQKAISSVGEIRALVEEYASLADPVRRLVAILSQRNGSSSR